MKKRYSGEQIIGFLKQVAEGVPTKKPCRKLGFGHTSLPLASPGWRHQRA
jgi:putative transposase